MDEKYDNPYDENLINYIIYQSHKTGFIDAKVLLRYGRLIDESTIQLIHDMHLKLDPSLEFLIIYIFLQNTNWLYDTRTKLIDIFTDAQIQDVVGHVMSFFEFTADQQKYFEMLYNLLDYDHFQTIVHTLDQEELQQYVEMALLVFLESQYNKTSNTDRDFVVLQLSASSLARIISSIHLNMQRLQQGNVELFYLTVPEEYYYMMINHYTRYIDRVNEFLQKNPESLPDNYIPMYYKSVLDYLREQYLEETRMTRRRMHVQDDDEEDQ